MAVTINASASAGLVTSADTSGDLNIQSGGSTKLAVTSAGVAVTGLSKGSLPTGSVLQVVNATTTTNTVTTSSTYQATSLTASITPTSATSKVLVTFSGVAATTGPCDHYSTIFRNGSNILPANGGPHVWYSALGGAATMYWQVAYNYLDSPASTSAQTYTIYIKNDNNTNTIQFGATYTAVITLMEIAA
jgi:hypothetical protein